MEVITAAIHIHRQPNSLAPQATKTNKRKSIPQQAPSIIAKQCIANLLSMGLAGTTYKGNQSGKSVDVDSGEVLLTASRRSRRVRDRGDRARQISHKTSADHVAMC